MSLKSLIEHLDTRLKVGMDRVEKGLNYLDQFGYIDKDNTSLDEIIDAVKKFQKAAGVLEDGEMGPKTLSAMNWPRCGVSDAIRVEFAKWGITSLKYYIEQRDTDLAPGTWDAIVDQAFQQWAAVANLKFARTMNKGEANFIMSVGSGSGDQFDGPNGTLAWAQLPPNNNFQGQLLCKCDTGETWRENLNNGNGILLLNVLCHEIGHLLGLEHSQVSRALMAPIYSPSVPKPVQNDDITRIQKLYGGPTGTPTDPPGVLAAPTNLTAQADGTDAVILRWLDNANGEEKYEIYRNDVNQGTVKAGSTSARDQQVPAGIHQYKVRAIAGTAVSGWSNTINIQLGTVTPPPIDETTVITIKGNIENISIEGYTITKIG